MKPIIQYTDFEKLEIRIGRIVTATAPEWSRKLLEFTVDFGEEIGERTIMSGVREWYAPEDFIGNSYQFIVNLAERKMGEGVSQGMMLMADSADKPVPIPVADTINAGTIVR
jgi:methionine--tRNA ligase beta chain